MLELLDDQSKNEEDTTSVSPKNTKVSLKLVVSNPNPIQKTISSQTTGSNRRTATSFTSEVRLKGPCLYEITIQDPSHYLACALILEIEESRDKYEGKKVVCHFPTLSVEELCDFVEDDETLYSAFMTQFQIKILEQLLLFCATRNAPTLVIYADDAQADNLDIYQDFLIYKDETLTSKGEKTEMIIPADQQTLASWVEFMQKINADFRQALWRDQSSNSIIRRYLKNHPLG